MHCASRPYSAPAARPAVGHSLPTRRSLLPGNANDEGGQAVLEFALVLPVLLLILFGIVQFGLALNGASDETHIASEVARYGTVNENPGEAEKRTLAEWGKRQLDNGAFQVGKSRLCISFPSGNEAGAPVKVEFTRTVSWLPILKLGATSTAITGSAVMRLESPATKFRAECAES
jgi:hypothetical protein